jgi:hypothetical protein
LTQPLRALFLGFLLLIAASHFILGCSVFNAAKKNTKPEVQEPSSEKQYLLPVDTLTSLEVVSDTCLVSVEPKKKSHSFGPLTRGEVVKWLEARENWIRVWIPRLRISGWVLQGGVEEIQDTNATQAPVPEREFTVVIAVSEKTNVRDVPAIKSEVILVADKGDAFFLLGEREGWCRVWLPEKNRTGWIFGRNLVRKGEK